MLTSEQLVKRMEAEERVENRFSWFYFAITFLLSMFFILMFALHPVTAHAKTISCTFDDSDFNFILPDDVSSNYPYTYIFLHYSAGWKYDVLCSDVRLYVDSNCTINGNNTFLVPLDVGNCAYYSVDCSSGDSGIYDLSKSSFSSPKLSVGKSLLYGTFKYSNVNVYKAFKNSDDVYTSTSDVFFQYPEVPVARVAVELPEVVQANLRTIIPVAVFCLASLIGCLVLAKKYRIFLH